jgi:predicted nucleic acid-binding protein
MHSFIVDTNVLVVANGKYQKASEDDVFKCQNFLIDLRKKHLSVDSSELIFQEYFKNASRSGQPGIGDAFAKWLWYNQWNPSICEQVTITPHPEREFLEFPEEENLKDFDRDDRKFVAVAVSSKFEAIICNATDTDWWDYREAFEKVGIKIKNLCPELFQRK